MDALYLDELIFLGTPWSEFLSAGALRAKDSLGARGEDNGVTGIKSGIDG